MANNNRFERIDFENGFLIEDYETGIDYSVAKVEKDEFTCVNSNDFCIQVWDHNPTTEEVIGAIQGEGTAFLM